MTDQQKKTRRELMKEKYLKLAQRAENEGNHDKAEKFKIAAKRC